MKRIAFIFCFIGTLATPAFGQEQDKKKIYEVNLAIDLPVAIAGSALTGYGFQKLEEKTSSTLAEVNSLNFDEEVSGFNQFFGGPRYSAAASNTSDVFFYGAMPLGLGLAIDKTIRKDIWTVLLMYWETLAVTGAIYSNTAANVVKYRPLAYPGSGAPIGERTEDGAKSSFPGGHPTITAASTFFIAKVLQDYYPEDRKMHYIAYSTASVLTLTNAYLRHRAGKHFTSDLLFGLAYSVPIGILVPQLHKIASGNDQFSVHSGPNGMTLTYTIE